VTRGGAKIIDKDLGWKELFKRAEEIENGRVRVGVLSDAMVEGEDFTLAELAAVHEYGTEDGRIPERSFLRSTFDDKREEMVELGKTLVKDVLAGRRTTEQALGLLGAKLAAAVKARIVGRIPPPNQPSTIARKGSDKPLIDTGRLRNAVTWSVDTGKDGE
jgi:hypothetical protein